MSRLPKILLLIMLLLVCAVWSPWSYLNINFLQLFGALPPDKQAGLQVTSLAGTLDIYVDGIKMGQATPESTFNLPGIKPGEHLVKLERQGSNDADYWTYNKLLQFNPGIDVVMAWELGPTEDFSQGHTIYARKLSNNLSNATLNIRSNTLTTILINNISTGTTPLESYSLDLSNSINIIVSASGYDTQEFKLLPDTAESRNLFAGYEIFVDVQMFLQPIQFTNVST